LVLATIIAFATSAMGQQDPKANVPLDSSIRIGRLPNGMTYYIWHNEKPKERCEFRLVNDVGAIVERDDENGLAHFLEHVQFNNTLHFEGRRITEYFESVGVSFGGGVNAYTGLDETVYQLSNVPTTRQGIIDTALLVMYDWSCGALLRDEDIEKERGIIIEEWRTGQTAARRMRDQQTRMIMAGSQYAKRNIIGDTAVIRNFKPQTLRDFYHRWYGPDLQALVVVGDINVDSMELRIMAMFSDIPSREGLTPRPRYGAIDNEEPITGVYLDAEAQSQKITLGYKHPAVPKEQANTYEAHIRRSKIWLIRKCLETRLMDKYGKDPMWNIFALMGCSYSNLYGETDAFKIQVVVDNGRERELCRAVCEEMERIRRYGILQEELDIVLKDELASLERYQSRHVNITNEYRAENCINHFTTNRGMTTPQFDLEFHNQYLAHLTAEELNTMIPELFNDNDRNMFFVATGKAAPNADGMGCSECDMPTSEEMMAIYRQVRASTIEPPTAKKIDTRLVDKEPKGGKIISIRHNKEIDVDEVMLENNVRVIVKRTENTVNHISLEAYSVGGYSLYEPKDILNARYAGSIVSRSGVGKMTPSEQSKALSGKDVWIGSNYIGSTCEVLGGSCATENLDELLQVIYLTFTAPRTDEKAFSEFMATKKSDLTSDLSHPKNDFWDELARVKYGHSDRYIHEDTNTLKMVSLKRAMEIYRERFGNAADFTFYFVGDINIYDVSTMASIAKWLGGLRTSKKRDVLPAEPDYDAAKGKHFVYCKHEMKTQTASSQIDMAGYGFDYTLENIIKADLLSKILSTRLYEAIREGESGTYSVDVWGYLAKYNAPHVFIGIDFDTDPERQYLLINKIYDEIEKIIADGPLTTDLESQREIMIKEFEDELTQNYNVLDHVQEYYLNGFNYERDYLDILRSITAEDIRLMLKTVYDQQNIVEAALLPTR